MKKMIRKKNNEKFAKKTRIKNLKKKVILFHYFKIHKMLIFLLDYVLLVLSKVNMDLELRATYCNHNQSHDGTCFTPPLGFL